jgi:hypothetical protein
MIEILAKRIEGNAVSTKKCEKQARKKYIEELLRKS